MYIDGQEVQTAKHFKFLGVTFDERLSVASHCDFLTSSLKKKCSLLRCLNATTWGACTKMAETFRKGLIEPLTAYGSAAYVLCASDSNVAKIERVRNEAARISTACHQATSVNKLRKLIGIIPLKEHATLQATKTLDLSLRLSTTAPIGKEMATHCDKRMKRGCFIRNEAMIRAAEGGVLALRRSAIDAESMSIPEMPLFRILHTPVSKSVDPLEPKKKRQQPS